MQYLSSLIKKLSMFFMIVLLCMSLAGCATLDNREAGGTILGGLVGAATGYILDGPRGAIIGLMAGGIIGNRLGNYLDEREKRTVLVASQDAVLLETGEKQYWEVGDKEQEKSVENRERREGMKTEEYQKGEEHLKDPEEKITASGWVTPTTDIYYKDGKRCRDVTFVTHKRDKEYVETETMCEADGGWIQAVL